MTTLILSSPSRSSLPRHLSARGCSESSVRGILGTRKHHRRRGGAAPTWALIPRAHENEEEEENKKNKIELQKSPAFGAPTKRRRAKNAPTKRKPELSQKERAMFTALNARILECASAEQIGKILEEEDVSLSDVNVSTIFSLLGRKCNSKKKKKTKKDDGDDGDDDLGGWNALAIERLMTSKAFREKVLSRCEKDGFSNSSRIVSTILWSIARMKQGKVAFVENGGFESVWVSLENGLERVCKEQRTLLFEKIFPEYMPPKSCASIVWAYASVGKTVIPEHLRNAIESIVIKKISECSAGDIAVATWGLTRYGVDISAKNRNKYWKSIKERLLEPEVFEKEMHLENAARLVSASGAVSSGFYADFVVELARKAARDMSYKKNEGKMGTREYGHVVAMLVGLASSTSSSGTTDSGDGASKRESEEDTDRALMEALDPIFDEIIKTPQAFKPKQLAQCANAITRIVFSRDKSNWYKGHDSLLENVGIDIGDIGEVQKIQNSTPSEDEERLRSSSFDVAIRALQSIFRACTTDANVLAQFETRDYTNLLWAAIKSRAKIPVEFLEQCEDYAIDNLDALNELDLVYFTYSLGNAQNSVEEKKKKNYNNETYNPTRYLAYAVSRAEELAKNGGFDANVHIAPLLNSFAKNKFNPGMMLIDKCEKIIQSESSAQSLRPTVASQIMWSFTKLEYVPSDETLEKIEAAWLNPSSDGLNFRDFQEGSSLLIWAHATLGKLPSADLLLKLTTPPTKKAASFWTPVSMWMTFWSLSLLYACVATTSEGKAVVEAALNNFCEKIILPNGGIRADSLDKKGLGACYASILLLKGTSLQIAAKEAMPGDFEKVAKKQWILQKRKDSQTSKLQQQVEDSLRRLNVQFFEERELEDGLMRPDFFIESAAVENFLIGHRKTLSPNANLTKDIVLEVDGPHHFAISASTGHRTLLGSTAMRNFLLKERLGLRLGVILFDEWGQLQSSSERDEYVENILLETSGGA
jgi:hypothetical protein